MGDMSHIVIYLSGDVRPSGRCLSMYEQTITVPGKPIAKKRPRFFRRGKFVGTYNEQETEEGKFMLLINNQWNFPPIDKGIKVELGCTFYMPIPKSTSKKKRENLNYHTKKPDLDNLVKFVKDCANGIIWHDDSQVAILTAGKYYSKNPRTEIMVRWEG